MAHANPIMRMIAPESLNRYTVRYESNRNMVTFISPRFPCFIPAGTSSFAVIRSLLNEVLLPVVIRKSPGTGNFLPVILHVSRLQ